MANYEAAEKLGRDAAAESCGRVDSFICFVARPEVERSWSAFTTHIYGFKKSEKTHTQVVLDAFRVFVGQLDEFSARMISECMSGLEEWVQLEKDLGVPGALNSYARQQFGSICAEMRTRANEQVDRLVVALEGR